MKEPRIQHRVSLTYASRALFESKAGFLRQHGQHRLRDYC